MNTSDVVIVGGGLSGLVAGNLLSQRGYSVTLCESQEKMGGKNRVDTSKGILIPYDLPIHIPLPLDHIEWITEKTSPLMLQKMQWIPLNLELLTSEQKSLFHSDYRLPKGGMGKIYEFLSQSFKTELSQPSLQSVVEESCIKKITGFKKEWEAKVFLVTTDFKNLLSLVEKQRFHPQFLRKVKRRTSVSAIKLDFILKSKVFEGKNLLFFPECNGVGYFSSNIDPSLSDGDYQIAQMVFFIDSETLLNNEAIAKKLKAGKRFISKAFLDFFDKVIWEKMTLIESFFHQEPLEFKKEWTTLKNLFWVEDFQKMDEEIERIEQYLSGRSLGYASG